MREEQQLVREFLAARPRMAENNSHPEKMKELLQQEVDELCVEIDAGDTAKIAQEIPDVIFFCLSIAELHGIDVENMFWGKTCRNEFKYKAELFQDGMSYEEAASLCRALWAQNGNDADYL